MLKWSNWLLIGSVAMASLGIGTVSFAHEGHGDTPPGHGATLWHYLTDASHVSVIAGVLLASSIGLLCGFLLKRRRFREQMAKQSA